MTQGGLGIRTLARFYTSDGFQDRSLQPDLGNPPKNSGEGDRTPDLPGMNRTL